MSQNNQSSNKSFGWRKKANVFDDPCAVHIRERQSIDTGDYPLDNFFRKCGQPILSQSGINQTFNFPQVWGNVYQCGVDYDSDLRYADLTNLKFRQQLFTRP